ncbi:hypothetical protein EFW17_06660 [Halostreptopolyspora alba]|uniref:Uncharacterized protein n=1 Tax=Halostreptopolyspora alba TaxID=2487137 RepID=A0A3N0EEC6_9ACTN|nr:hypothetical protein EFW17_06660 [Nocardiopsaceae bacterium YIM 96095]
MSSRRTVSLVTPGCARNEVDPEELAGHLATGGWELVESENGDRADIAVNTRDRAEPALRESVDVPARGPDQR